MSWWSSHPKLSEAVLWVAMGTSLLTLTVSISNIDRFWRKKKSHLKSQRDIVSLIGNTPMIRINSLSNLTGCEILGKCEFLNPGGSVKDRVALRIIQEAEKRSLISPHAIPKWKIFEGTSGSTGISLALVARALGYEAEIVLPDDTAREKSELIEKMGASVVKVRPVSIVHASHYVNLARQRAAEYRPSIKSTSSEPSPHRGYFVDQFENLINGQAHYETTAPEIWEQTHGQIDVFVSGAGTGGTISGVGRKLKGLKSDLQIILADPQGSGLFHKVKDGVMYCQTEAEGKRRRHQMDTIVEGIGLNRSTQNFDRALHHITDAIRVTDQEAIKMSRYLVLHEGLFLGSSSAINLVACLKLAKQSKPLTNLVCILCDGGQRHLSKFWNDQYLLERGFEIEIEDDFDPLLYF